MVIYKKLIVLLLIVSQVHQGNIMEKDRELMNTNPNLINIYCITKDTVFFINTVSEELTKSNPNTIVTVKNDQYIEPYSVIAFINFLTNKTLQISYIKSNLNIKNKILYVIEKFYLYC